MIDTERAREHLLREETLLYREYDGRIAYTLWKSQRTPERYYWYTIQDIPRKVSQKVVTLFESSVFYNLDDLFVDFKRGDNE